MKKFLILALLLVGIRNNTYAQGFGIITRSCNCGFNPTKAEMNTPLCNLFGTPTDAKPSMSRKAYDITSSTYWNWSRFTANTGEWQAESSENQMWQLGGNDNLTTTNNIIGSSLNTIPLLFKSYNSIAGALLYKNTTFGDGTTTYFSSSNIGNTFIGSGSISGSNNTIIGYNPAAFYTANNGLTIIGANQYYSNLPLNSILLGNGAITEISVINSQVGIGLNPGNTPASGAKVEINGTNIGLPAIKLVDGTERIGKVLTSDEDGVASWTDLPAFPKQQPINIGQFYSTSNSNVVINAGVIAKYSFLMLPGTYSILIDNVGVSLEYNTIGPNSANWSPLSTQTNITMAATAGIALASFNIRVTASNTGIENRYFNFSAYK